MHLSHSKLITFMKCPRLFRYQYLIGRLPKATRLTLTFGRASHKALESILKEEQPNIDVLVSEMETMEQHRLKAMLHQYKRPDVDITDIEYEFEVPIPKTKHIITGRIDAIGTKHGSPWIIEHKTTSQDIEGHGQYWQAMLINHQLSIYLAVTMAEGCIYDVLRKPQLRRRMAKKETWEEYRTRLDQTIAETPGKWYQQREIRLQPEEIQQAWMDLTQQAQQLEYAYDNDSWPRNSTSCRNLFGMCQYLDVCTGAANIDDDSLFRNKEWES